MRSGTGNTRSKRTVAPVSRASEATKGTTASLRSSAPIGARIRLVIVQSPLSIGMNGHQGRIRRVRKAPESETLRGGPTSNGAMVSSQEGGESAMRVFLLFVVMVLFMALGALEVIASRAALPLP